jgi:PAS domain S-box-containing protein
MIVYSLEVAPALERSIPTLVVHMVTGEIMWANRPLETLFGYTVGGELVGKCVDTLIPANLRNDHKQHRADYNQTPEMRPMGVGKKLEGQHRNGSTFPVIVILVPQVIGGERCVIAEVLKVDEVK